MKPPVFLRRHLPSLPSPPPSLSPSFSPPKPPFLSSVPLSYPPSSASSFSSSSLLPFSLPRRSFSFHSHRRILSSFSSSSSSSSSLSPHPILESGRGRASFSLQSFHVLPSSSSSSSLSLPSQPLKPSISSNLFLRGRKLESPRHLRPSHRDESLLRVFSLQWTPLSRRKNLVLRADKERSFIAHSLPLSNPFCPSARTSEEKGGCFSTLVLHRGLQSSSPASSSSLRRSFFLLSTPAPVLASTCHFPCCSAFPSCPLFLLSSSLLPLISRDRLSPAPPPPPLSGGSCHSPYRTFSSSSSSSSSLASKRRGSVLPVFSLASFPSEEEETEKEARKRWGVFSACLYFVLMSVAFAFVPLYEAFCQSTGYGGEVQIRKPAGRAGGGEQEEEEDGGTGRRKGFGQKTGVPTRERTGDADEVLLEIDFASHCNLPWEFKPLQKKILVAPGESALAFYRAKNKLDRPLIGISLYNVMPPEAGIYFNKIQCFCFEEQMLNPHEEVDLPVFFFIDPDILDDPRLEQMRRITLSYVFNESDAEIPRGYQELAAASPRTTDEKTVVL